jgi:hypothetical protein
MALGPIPLSAATALLISGTGWVAVSPGTLAFVQQAVMLDETGSPVPLPEPWVQFVVPGDPAATPPTADQPSGFPWRAVEGVQLAALAEPITP